MSDRERPTSPMLDLMRTRYRAADPADRWRIASDAASSFAEDIAIFVVGHNRPPRPADAYGWRLFTRLAFLHYVDYCQAQCVAADA